MDEYEFKIRIYSTPEDSEKFYKSLYEFLNSQEVKWTSFGSDLVSEILDREERERKDRSWGSWAETSTGIVLLLIVGFVSWPFIWISGKIRRNDHTTIDD